MILYLATAISSVLGRAQDTLLISTRDDLVERIVLLDNGVYVQFDMVNDKQFGRVLAWATGHYVLDGPDVSFTPWPQAEIMVNNQLIKCCGNGSGPKLNTSTDSIMTQVFGQRPEPVNMVDGYCTPPKSGRFRKDGSCSIGTGRLTKKRFEMALVPVFH